MRALTARHDIVAVQISDPRDAELPPVGMVTLVDPESGRTKEVRVTRALADRFGAAAAAHQAEVDAALRRVGVPLLRLATDRDWVGDVVRFVVRRKRGWTGSSGPAPKAAAR
jgi:uncharacterized protein (DUF58 family)